MPALTSDTARATKLAALALPLLLVAAAFAAHLTAGALAAVALVAATALALLAGLLVITRRQLQHAREQQRLGRHALDALPLALFVVDRERRGAPNVFVNAAYAALTGYGAREAVSDGFDAGAIFTGDAGDLGIPTLAAGLDRGSARAVVRRRDGTTFPAKIELHAVPRGDGGRYLVGTIEDVTAGERAADREARGRPEPPSSAGDSAGDSAGRATGAFLAWLSHELRSPLNACLMWLDVLALGPQPDKLPQAIDAIKRGLARQAKLVSDLNDTAKVAAGGFDLRLERLDLVALIASAAGAWQLLAIGKQLKFQQRIDLEAASVNGDAERLLLALNHLVESSINSTPAHGSVDLRVYGAGDKCVVAVEDTGPALSAEDAANLFTPLERSPRSAKGRSGLGLGLAVAYHVAAQHGGSLAAASEESSTRFVLELPLAASAPWAAAGGSGPHDGGPDRSAPPAPNAAP